MLFIPLFDHCKSCNTCSTESCLRLRVTSHWLLRSWPRFVLMSILSSLSCFSQSKILSLHLTLPKRSHVRGEAHVLSIVNSFVSSYAHFVTHNRMGLKAIGLFWGGGTLRLAAISLGSPTSRFFSALERRQLVIRSHNETLFRCRNARQQRRSFDG